MKQTLFSIIAAILLVTTSAFAQVLLTQNANGDLVCSVNGDSAGYEYDWFVNGQQVQINSFQYMIGAAMAHKGESWRCEVSEYLGYDFGYDNVGSSPTLVVQNRAPVITTAPITNATVSAIYTYDVDATDIDGDVLTYSVVSAPAGMTINPSTGVISWTPATAGSNAVTVSVSDGTATQTQSFTIVVSGAANTAPVFTSAPVSATVGVNTAYSFTATATDANAGQTLTFSDDNALFNINPSTGLISFTTPAAPTTITATLTVCDNLAACATQPFVLNVVAVPPVNVAPVINTAPVTTGTVGVAYAYDVNATDGNGDVLTYSVVSAPAGMTINPSTGMISWTPAAAGTYTVNLSVSDGALTASQQYSLVITTAANSAPVFTTAPVSATVFNNTLFAFDVNASDPDVGQTLTFSDNAGAFNIDATTGMISFTPTTVGVISATLTVCDNLAACATQPFFLNVVAQPPANTPPNFTSTPVIVAVNNTAYAYTAVATGSAPITYALVSAPTGMTINTASGILSWTPTATGNVVVNISATNANGVANQVFTITVNPQASTNTAPVITSTAVVTATNNTLYTYDVNAVDAQNNSLSYALVSAPTGMTINTASGVIQWTPTSTGTFVVNVSVSDGQLTANQVFGVVVAAQSTASSSSSSSSSAKADEDDLFVESIVFTQDVVSQGNFVDADITLENQGTVNMKDLIVTMSIDNLGLTESTSKFTLNNGKKTTKHVSLQLPSTMAAGTYNVKFTIKNDDFSVTKQKTIVVKGTTQVSAPVVSQKQTAPVVTQTPPVQNAITGNAVAGQSTSDVNWAGISAMSILLLVLLAVAGYLVRRIIQERQGSVAINALDGELI